MPEFLEYLVMLYFFRDFFQSKYREQAPVPCMISHLFLLKVTFYQDLAVKSLTAIHTIQNPLYFQVFLDTYCCWKLDGFKIVALPFNCEFNDLV